MNNTQIKKRLITIILVVMGIFDIVVLLLLFQHKNLKCNSHYFPDYDRLELYPYTQKVILSESDYDTLKKQTGLSPCIINSLSLRQDYYRQLNKYQENMFHGILIRRQGSIFLTGSEYIKGTTKKWQPAVIPLKDADILYTPSSSTLGWRNGHMGIVINARKNLILEAVAPGISSKITHLKEWKTYPAFMVLRLKDTITSKNPDLINNIINFASKNLVNVPYSLTNGITNSKYPAKLTGSNCAHIIWYAFMKENIDLDSNKGLIVTPYDIINSRCLEKMQVYGIKP